MQHTHVYPFALPKLVVAVHLVSKLTQHLPNFCASCLSGSPSAIIDHYNMQWDVRNHLSGLMHWHA